MKEGSLRIRESWGGFKQCSWPILIRDIAVIDVRLAVAHHVEIFHDDVERVNFI